MSGGGDMTREWLKRNVKKHICNILCIVNKSFNPLDYSKSPFCFGFATHEWHRT